MPPQFRSTLVWRRRWAGHILASDLSPEATPLINGLWEAFLRTLYVKELFKALLQVRACRNAQARVTESHQHSRGAICLLSGDPKLFHYTESLWNVNPGAWNAVYFSRSTKWKPLSPQIHQKNELFHLHKWTVRNNGHVADAFAAVPQRGKASIPNKAASFLQNLRKEAWGEESLIYTLKSDSMGWNYAAPFSGNTQKDIHSLPLGCRWVSPLNAASVVLWANLPKHTLNYIVLFYYSFFLSPFLPSFLPPMFSSSPFTLSLVFGCGLSLWNIQSTQEVIGEWPRNNLLKDPQVPYEGQQGGHLLENTLIPQGFNDACSLLSQLVLLLHLQIFSISLGKLILSSLFIIEKNRSSVYNLKTLTRSHDIVGVWMERTRCQ